MGDANLEITDDDNRRCRLLLLISKGGGLVLRHKLKNEFISRGQNIEHDHIKRQIKTLKESRRPCINERQYKRIYPDSGSSSPDDYDITLLVFLHRTLFHDSTNSRWNSDYILADTDTSDIAEIVRIRNFRNEVKHQYEDGELNETTFNDEWERCAEVLVRFGNDIPGLTNELEKLKKEPIDKKREEDLLEQLRQWEKLDEDMENRVIKTIRQHSARASVLDRSCKEVSDVLDDKYFVKTDMFSKAKDMLETDGVIVIKGAQGEGKTTIAKKLVNNPAKCLKINSAADWDMYSRKDVETILIDDMFGCTMFDKTESRNWLKILPQLMCKVLNKEVKLIITSRSYILDDAQKKLFISHHIKECNMLEICSKKLEDIEKTKILKKHFKKNEKKTDKDLIEECVRQSNKPTSFIIGFPECASLFCSEESLFEKKGAFFETPMTHIKKCLKSVFEKDGAFLAFFVLWAQPSQKLCLVDLERSPEKTPNYIKDPIEHLAYDLYSSLRTISDILSINKDSVYYDTKTETFRFQHQVLGDAVGLVAFEKNKTAVLEFCNASFIERYVCIEGQTIDKNKDDTILIIIPKRFDHLCLRIGKLMFPNLKGSNEEPYMNCSLLLHPAFKEKAFCAKFIETMREQEMLFELLTKPVGTVVTNLLEVKSVIDKGVINTEIGILVYALSNSLMEFAMACYSELERHNAYKGRFETDLKMSMLLAVVEGNKNRIQYLTTEMKFQSVDCNIILSAMKKADGALLDTVLDISKMPISQYKREGKSPLMIFVEENNKNAVTCILKSKYFDRDVDYQNEKDKKTALHIACKQGYLEITQLLLTQNPNLQLRDNNNECPIHSAALKGNTEIVDLLLGHDIKQGDYVLDLSDTLYHLAVRKHNDSLLEVLLKHELPVTCTNEKKQTPLVYALQNQKFTMIPKLINKSIYQNAHTYVDKEGQTALHLATERLLSNNLNDGEYVDILNDTVELLSKDGAGRIPNKLGHTPLQNVLKKRQYLQKKLDVHDNVIKTLKKYE